MQQLHVHQPRNLSYMYINANDVIILLSTNHARTLFCDDTILRTCVHVHVCDVTLCVCVRSCTVLCTVQRWRWSRDCCASTSTVDWRRARRVTSRGWARSAAIHSSSSPALSYRVLSVRLSVCGSHTRCSHVVHTFRKSRQHQLQLCNVSFLEFLRCFAVTDVEIWKLSKQL